MPQERFDYEALDDLDPFEINNQLIHLYKHEGMDVTDIFEVWTDDPMFYEARTEGPADWLMVGQTPGNILCVPLMPGREKNKARPIGVYPVRPGTALDKQYRQDTG